LFAAIFRRFLGRRLLHLFNSPRSPVQSVQHSRTDSFTLQKAFQSTIRPSPGNATNVFIHSTRFEATYSQRRKKTIQACSETWKWLDTTSKSSSTSNESNGEVPLPSININIHSNSPYSTTHKISCSELALIQPTNCISSC